jgi:hypothetical protein
MTRDTVMVLTSKSFETMIREGGSGNWKANEESVRRCKWLVAVRNRHSDWSEGKEDHGTAFLIGRIVGVKPSPKPGRLVIVFDQYAVLDRPATWPAGFRNPVAYTSLKDLGLKSDELKWKVFPGNPSQPAGKPKADGEAGFQRPSVVLEKAKLMIAESLSIAPSAVRISIQI